MTPPDQPEKKGRCSCDYPCSTGEGDQEKCSGCGLLVNPSDAPKTMGEGPFRVGRYFSEVDDNFFYGVFVGPFVGDQEDFDGVNLMSHCDGNTVESVVRAKCAAMNEFVLSWLKEKGWGPTVCRECGGTDMVCAKGWIKERDALQKELSALKEKVKLADEMVQALRSIEHGCWDSATCQRIASGYSERYAKAEGGKS